MLFYKSPQNLFNALFNLPQGITMTLAMGLYTGNTAPAELLRAFACAYCAGVMLTAFIRVPEFGQWCARKLHCPDKGVGTYLVQNLIAGALMGVLMNFFITFMSMGPIPAFPVAYLSALPFAMLISALSSCTWIWMCQRVVAHCYPQTAE